MGDHDPPAGRSGSSPIDAALFARSRTLPAMARTCVLIPGDGIGPEVCDAVVRVLDASGAGIDWDRQLAGLAAVEAGATEVLPAATCDAIRRHGIALKGPCTT